MSAINLRVTHIHSFQNNGDWQKKFCSLDRGQLLVRRDLLSAFQVLGWQTLEDVLSTENLQLSMAYSDRDNCSVQLPAAAGKPAKRAYLKRHGAAEPALAEAAAVDLCQQAGVPCMRVAAIGTRGDDFRGDGWQAFFMSEEIGQGESAFQRVERLRAAPTTAANAAANAEILAIIAAVADTTRKLHTAGIFHSDCHWQHFLLETLPDDQVVATLIDLQNTRSLQGTAAHYAWIKDLAQLSHSMRRLQLTPAEVDYWYEAYFSEGNPLGSLWWPRRTLRMVVDARANLREFRRAVSSQFRTFRRASMWL